MTPRERAVAEGRAIVRVRDQRSGRLIAVGVCPGCWSSPSRRRELVADLASRGLAVVHGADAATGAYRGPAAHAGGCPREEKS